VVRRANAASVRIIYVADFRTQHLKMVGDTILRKIDVAMIGGAYNVRVTGALART
jgi:hypothetical protein